jgi:hypothetical protein
LAEKTNQPSNNSSQNAVQWFKDSIRGLKKNQIGKQQDYLTIIKNNKRNVKTTLRGQVLLFQYRPKDKPKFYDRFPLIIVLDFKGRNLLGLNLHYVPPLDRLRLLALMNTLIFNKNESNFQNTRIRILSLLNKQIFAKYLGTAVNYYTVENIVGKPKITTPEEWTHFAFLPLFRGINPTKLYAEIKQRVNNKNV